MRVSITILAAALAACGPDQAVTEATVGDANLAGETIVANDTTAIDAATGDDANMAEDASIKLNEVVDTETNSAADNAAADSDSNQTSVNNSN
jgi:hypothetical protein